MTAHYRLKRNILITAGEPMTSAHYSLVASIIFALVAILQIARAATRLPVTVGKTVVPVWASWLACAVAAVLAWLGYSASHS